MKLKCDILVSNFAFKCNLYRYTKGNPPIQNLLVQKGMRGMVRKCLVDHPTVSFHGEFTDLRDWIRGDRGGAKAGLYKLKSVV